MELKTCPFCGGPATAYQDDFKKVISRQMEEAGRQAQERQAPPVHKKDAPDRGDR